LHYTSNPYAGGTNSCVVGTMCAQHNLNESIHEDKVNEVIDQIYGNIMMEISKAKAL